MCPFKTPVCTFKTFPCVRAPHACVPTCARGAGMHGDIFECTHGDVLSGHTEFRSVSHTNTPHTHHNTRQHTRHLTRQHFEIKQTRSLRCERLEEHSQYCLLTSCPSREISLSWAWCCALDFSQVEASTQHLPCPTS